MAESESTNFFTRKLYDQLKFIALIVLPALATLWFGVGGLWHIPHTTEVVGTITAVDAFLGVILQVSSNQYYKNGANFDGQVNLVSTEEGETVKFKLDKDPAEIIVDDPGKHSLEYRIERKAPGTENS